MCKVFNNVVLLNLVSCYYISLNASTLPWKVMLKVRGSLEGNPCSGRTCSQYGRIFLSIVRHCIIVSVFVWLCAAEAGGRCVFLRHGRPTGQSAPGAAGPHVAGHVRRVTVSRADPPLPSQ